MSSYVDKSKKKLAPKAPARRSAPNVAPSQSPLPDTPISQTSAGQPQQPVPATDTSSLFRTSPPHTSPSHERPRDTVRDEDESTQRVRSAVAAEHRSEPRGTSRNDEQQATEPAAKRRKVAPREGSSSTGREIGTDQPANGGVQYVEDGAQGSRRRADGGEQQPEHNGAGEPVRATLEGGQSTRAQSPPAEVRRARVETPPQSSSERQHLPDAEHSQSPVAGRTVEIESQDGSIIAEAGGYPRDASVVDEGHEAGQVQPQPSTRQPAVNEAPETDAQNVETSNEPPGLVDTQGLEATTAESQLQPQAKKRKQPVKRKRAAPDMANRQGAEGEVTAEVPAPRKRQRKSNAQGDAGTDGPAATGDTNGEHQADTERATNAEGGEQPETLSEQQVRKRAAKKSKPKPKRRPRNATQARASQQEGDNQANAGTEAAVTNGDTQSCVDNSTEQPENTAASATQRLPVPRKKRKRAETPSENEDYEIDTSKVTIFELMKDRRRGKKGAIEKEMENIDWDEVKRRRKEAEARARAAGQKASRREAQRELEEEDERRQEQQEAQQADTEEGQGQPGIAMENGEIVIDNASLRMNRHQPIDETAEVITEETVTKRVNARSHLFDNRRDPEDRIYTPPGRWTQAETDVFYAALKMFGTDFDMISKMFHGRNRRQIKHKFVREERDNGWRINAVLLGQPDPMNFEKYCEFTGQGAEDFKDPKELEAELKEDEERQRMEIEQEREQAQEVQRRKQEAARAKAEAAQRRRSGEKVPRKRRSKKDKADEAPVADGIDGEEAADGADAEQTQAGEGGEVEHVEAGQTQQDGEQAASGANEKPKRTRRKAINPKPRARKAGAADKGAGGQAGNDGSTQEATGHVGDQINMDGETNNDNEVVQSIEID